MREEKSDIAWLLGMVVLAVVLRLWFLLADGAVIDGDEAIVGLMAKHIAEGRAWPVFFYGQAYMGSLEAILAAGLFTLFGISTLALKAVPLIFSVLLVIPVYALAQKLADRFAARIASLLCALAPHALTLWSGKARGGFIEIVFLGTVVLVLTVGLLQEERRHPSRSKLILLGVLCGLGWWTNNQFIFYLAAVGLGLAVHWWRAFGVSQMIRSGAVAGVSFLIGGIPFWWSNFFSEPRFQTFTDLLGRKAPGGSGFLEHLSDFFAVAAPILLGGQRFWSGDDIFPFAGPLVLSLYATLALFAVIGFRTRTGQTPVWLLWLFILATALIFSASSFGWLARAPRYLLPLYSVIFVLAGIGAARLVNLLRGIAIPGIVVLGILSVHLLSHFEESKVALAGQPVVYEEERVALSHQELYTWLAEHNYTHIRTNYWIGYRVAFETAEAVTFTRFGRPRDLRLPQYEAGQMIDYAEGVYVMVPREARPFTRELAAFGYSFRSTPVGEYQVIDNIVREYELGEPLDLSPSQFLINTNAERVGKLVDDDLGSRWASGSPQRPGMYFEVGFAQPTLISGVRFDYGFFKHDAPRGLTVEGLRPDGSWCLVFELAGTKIAEDLREQEFAEIPQVWSISFEPMSFQRIRVMQQGFDRTFDWSLAEFDILTPLKQKPQAQKDNTTAKSNRES